MVDLLLRSAWLIPLYGLLGMTLTLPWSLGLMKRTGPRPAAYLNLLMTVLAVSHGSVVFALIWHHGPVQLFIHWLQVADLDLVLAVEISPVSMGAMEVVTGISLLAQLYALGYMEKDWSLARFYGLMGFFEGALAGIAISDSLILTYGLLEMLTLSTYLLVGFWYAQPLVVTAARDAFLTKRVGDIFLLMGVVALSYYGGEGGLTFSELERWAETATLQPWVAALLGLALIAGPTGKCAQFPLHLWLDEAMEGPNPASIMRNSIVVSVGAYVLIKFQAVFALSPVASTALVVIGATTSVGACLVAIAQIDIKRALSHSTSAAMGLVFIAVGLQQADVALLLLLTHGIAKALVFMSLGAVIFTTSSQDMTEMGGLWSRMPATTTAYVVGAMGLTNLLPLGTFWAFRRWVNGFWEAPPWLMMILITVSALTALNLARVFRLVFLGKPQPKTRRSPEVGWAMALPMVSLSIVTLLAPLMLQHWQFLLSWTGPWARGGRWLNGIDMPLIMAAGIAGVGLAFTFKPSKSWSCSIRSNWRFLQDLLAYDFYVGQVYNLTVVATVAVSSRVMAWLDRYVVDGLVNALGLATVLGGQGLKYSVSGQSQFYILTILVGVGALLVLITNWPF